MSIGVSSLPDLRKAFCTKRGARFNLMVVGSNGLGKTTLINNLLRKPILKSNPFEQNSNNESTYYNSVCNIQVSHIELKESEFGLKMSIVEVDGISDQVDNTGCEKPVLEELKSRFFDYEKLLQKNVKMMVEDCRIHLCIYLVEPIEYFKAADLEVLKAIAPYCNIVPVIPKLDILNKNQVNIIREKFKKVVEEEGISFYNDGITKIEYPIFISMGSVLNEGITMSREYPWGKLNVLELEENGFSKLRDFIFEKSLLKLIDSTDAHYENFRVLQLADLIARKETAKNDDSGIVSSKVGIFDTSIRNMKLKMECKQSDGEINPNAY